MINKKIKSVEFKGMIYLSKLNRTWLLGEFGLSVPQSGVLLLSARASFKCSYDFILGRRKLSNPPRRLRLGASSFNKHHFDAIINNKHLSVGAKALFIVSMALAATQHFLLHRSIFLLFLNF